jgi:phenylpropionate dioxygenase-like ring-hydroxylating dioxygenase large terminal subunit
MASVISLQESLQKGRTLPASWYHAADVYQLEQERIFADAWHYVCLVHDVQNPGEFFTCKIGAVPVVVLRDLEHNLRAYVNVCGHRGAEVVLEEKGCRKTLQCHYHAWTWGLDGQLRGAPSSHKQPCFNKADYPLTALHVRALGPFVFVALSQNPIPWQTLIADFPEKLQSLGVDWMSLKKRGRKVYNIQANWKVVTENFLECYHCPVSHPGFCDVIDIDQYHVNTYGYFSMQKGPMTPKAREEWQRTSQGLEVGVYNYLWPHFMVNFYPGKGNASTNLLIPQGPHNTLAIYEFFYNDDVSHEQAEQLTALIDQTQIEDVVICESVQRGLMSGYYHQGQLMQHVENGIQHFQSLVCQALERNDRI